MFPVRGVVACGVVLLGCGDNITVAVQPPPDEAGPCWPTTTTPGGEIELGTGNGGFQPMPPRLQFIRGTQGGTFLIVNVRVRGLTPGNPKDFYDKSNPKTLFSAIEQDGTVIRPQCPGTVGFVPSAEAGYFERARAQNLEFLPWEVGERAFDTEVRLIVEVVDQSGRYARDERVVFAEAPAPFPTSVDAAVPLDAELDAGATGPERP